MCLPAPGKPAPEGEVVCNDEMSLISSMWRLWHGRALLAKISACTFLLALGASFLIPNTYEATMELMPPDTASGGSSIMAAMTGSAGLPSLAGDLLGMKTNTGVFIGILRSRAVRDRMVEKYQLQAVYKKKRKYEAREVLAANTEVSEDKKTGIISVVVRDHSPKRAAALAQEYLDELNSGVSNLSTSSAHREREFLERRLEEVRRELTSASTELAEYSANNRTLDMSTQGKATVESAARLEGELIAAETELKGLEQIYTGSNIRVQAARAKVGELKRHVSTITGAGGASDVGSVGPSLRNLPALSVKYFELLRRVKTQEAVYEVLTRQFEMAKVQEVKELPTVKVLDPPVVPEKKVSPHRGVIAAVSMVVAVLLAAFVLVMRPALANVDPSWVMLFSAMRGRGVAADQTAQGKSSLSANA